MGIESDGWEAVVRWLSPASRRSAPGESSSHPFIGTISDQIIVESFAGLSVSIGK